MTAAVYEIMVTTKAMQEYELQVVAAQDRIAKPAALLQRNKALAEISHFRPTTTCGPMAITLAFR